MAIIEAIYAKCSDAKQLMIDNAELLNNGALFAAKFQQVMDRLAVEGISRKEVIAQTDEAIVANGFLESV